MVLANTVSPAPQGSKHLHKVLADSHKATAKPKVEPPAALAPVVEAQAETSVPEAAPVAAPEPVTPPEPVVTSITGCGSDPNMAYIYSHESGCRTGAINSIGCAGLGQACPGSKLPCGLGDWVCQNAYFVSYAIGRYGSTGAAVAFWQSHSWW